MSAGQGPWAVSDMFRSAKITGQPYNFIRDWVAIGEVPAELFHEAATPYDDPSVSVIPSWQLGKKLFAADVADGKPMPTTHDLFKDIAVDGKLFVKPESFPEAATDPWEEQG